MVGVSSCGQRRNLPYRINELPPASRVQLLQVHLRVDDGENVRATITWASVCSIYRKNQVKEVIDVAKDEGIDRWEAGRVETALKQIIIEPLKLIFALRVCRSDKSG